jgi:hypothetical protein
MNVIPSMVIPLVTVGLVTADRPKVAVSPAVSGTLAGSQFPAVFQLFVAGAASQVCAELELGINTRLHNAAIDDASILAGLTVGGC